MDRPEQHARTPRTSSSSPNPQPQLELEVTPCEACGATEPDACRHRQLVALGDPDARRDHRCRHPYDPAVSAWPDGY